VKALSFWGSSRKRQIPAAVRVKSARVCARVLGRDGAEVRAAQPSRAEHPGLCWRPSAEPCERGQSPSRSAWALRVLPRGEGEHPIETPINPPYLGERGGVPNGQRARQGPQTGGIMVLRAPGPLPGRWEPASVRIHCCNSRSRSRAGVGITFWGRLEKVRERGEQSGVMGLVSWNVQ